MPNTQMKKGEDTHHMEEEKTALQQRVNELRELLDQQDADLAKLRNERNQTVRKLKRTKLDMAIPSQDVLKLARNVGPMEDVFFNKVGEDLAAIEEIIQTILDVPLKARKAIPQFMITNMGSRGVRLDNYAEIIVEAELLDNCELGEKGTIVDIEVQKEDNCDHEFRVYYNGASMIINRTPAKTDFQDLPHAVVIYISAFDPFKEGKVFYETVKVDKESKNPRRSPVRELYANTKNLDKASEDKHQNVRKVAALMKMFRDPDWYDDQFPEFTRRKKELHETEGGVEEVSKELQLLIDQEVEKTNRRNAEEIKQRDEKIKQRDEKIKQKDEEIKQKDEEIEKIKRRKDMEMDHSRIDTIRIIKEKLNLTTQQAMNWLGLSDDQQARYVSMV